MTDPVSERRRVAAEEYPGHALFDDATNGIVEQLREDGRRPYAMIGRAVGLSETTVRQRVRRLLDSGVMQIVAVTDPVQLGLVRRAMVGVCTYAELEETADLLVTLPGVDHVVVTAGSFDLLVEVVARDDDEHLLEILEEIRAVADVRTTEAFVHLALRT
ncbi:MAG: Lrp/AsnC family transcriptional regulator [Actinophytocola sp.]|uniref:Lrp/AsnC family transcriptional regulator n=1 Tax=Actinophytocola sp. TaxID=1872138 RepID=UPI003D6BDA73